MTEPRKGWSWFERDDMATPRPESGATDLPDPDQALRRAYARCFGDADGKQVLAHLRAITLERAFGPGVSAGTLRHIEGQRQLVSYIAALTDRGRSGG